MVLFVKKKRAREVKNSIQSMQPTEELPVKINHGPHGCHTCQGKFMSKENKGSPSKNYKILVHFILTLIFPHLNDLKKIE